jgi:L-threonylcarbamoyladenylate synthase
VAPGMLTSHYAPKAALRLDARWRATRRGAPRLRTLPPSFSGMMYNLSARGDLIEAAANLFSHLRRAGRFRGKARRGNESAARRSRRGDQ